eukprot:snap_masked-scaffold_6-processed-gene-5.37-mRNA-1 protein AED:1.00 eAED:1.00 QI:0/-1/0/0/-1/1/1/0/81
MIFDKKTPQETFVIPRESIWKILWDTRKFCPVRVNVSFFLEKQFEIYHEANKKYLPRKNRFTMNTNWLTRYFKIKINDTQF